MKKNLMGIVFACESDSKLNELTQHRTTASIPIGGRYRLIDFALSNFVNSNVTSIGLITRSNYSSLMDHIRMGKDWDLSRKNSGLVIFPPCVLNDKTMFQGKIEALYGILDFFEKRPEEYVAICESNIVCKIDLEKVFVQHLKSEADITMVTYKTESLNVNNNIVKSENGRICDMSYAVVPSQVANKKTVNLKTYIIKKDLLKKLVEDLYVKGKLSFTKNLIYDNLKKLKIMEYCHDGYVSQIKDIQSYFSTNMDLLNYEIRQEIFNYGIKIYTKVMDSSPTVYLDNACVKNSLIADGCTIDGTVENSILFRGVTVEKNAIIKNSIVMQKGIIMTNSNLNFTITDKNVIIKSDVNLSGHGSYPIVIAKDIIV